MTDPKIKIFQGRKPMSQATLWQRLTATWLDEFWEKGKDLYAFDDPNCLGDLEECDYIERKIKEFEVNYAEEVKRKNTPMAVVWAILKT